MFSFAIRPDFLYFDMSCPEAIDTIFIILVMGKMLNALNIFSMFSSPSITFSFVFVV